MSEQLTEIESVLEQTSDRGIELFCEDISMMFDVGVKSNKVEVVAGNLKNLKKIYKRLTCLWTVKSEGFLNGNYHAIVDKEGLFTLGGTFVMHPEQIIAQNRKNGEEDESKDLEDAVSEVGNLMVGSFDRCFRENVEEHEHMIQAETVIGSLAKVEKSMDFGKEEELFLANYEMEIEPFEPFKISLIFPVKKLTGQGEVIAEESVSSEDAQGTSQVETEKQPNPAEAEAKLEGSEVDPTEQGEKLETEKAPADKASPVRTAIKELLDRDDLIGSGDVLGNLLGVNVKKLMEPVYWSHEQASLEEAHNQMQNEATDHLLIGQDGQAVGVLSKADIKEGMSPYLKPVFAKWKRQQDIATLKFKIKWLMSQPVYFVSESATLKDAIRVMFDNKVDFVPVKDEKGSVLGAISFQNLLFFLLN